MPSSVIHGMLYSPERRSLDIIFCDERGTCRYFAVGPEEWGEFKRAPSKGAFLNSSFKTRHPRFERLTSQPAELLASLAASVLSAPNDMPDENVWGFCMS
jgi:hypothetical protein